MFNIVAKIGDVVEVTYTNARVGGLMAEETINGRIAFRDRKDKTGRHTDRVRVRILNSNPSGTVYFLKTVQVVKLGDGVSTLLQKVRSPIDWREGLYGFKPDGTVTGLAIAEAHFGRDKRKFLDFVLGLMGVYAREKTPGVNSKLDWRAATKEVCHLIKQVGEGDAYLRQVYFRAGTYCHEVGERDMAFMNLSSALEHCGPQDAEHQHECLKVLEQVLGDIDHETFTCGTHVSILEQLIQWHEREGGLDAVRRLKLVKFYKEAKDFQAMSKVLLPLRNRVVELPEHNQVSVYRASSQYHLATGGLSAAEKEMESAYAVDSRLAGELAEICYQCGDYRRAADLFRSAFQDAQASLENALDDL